MRLLLAIAALLLSATHSAAYKEVAGWSIRMNPGGCVASRDYADGSRLSFAITTQFEWAIGIANQSWKQQQQKGYTFDMAVHVDGKFVASGTAAVLDDPTSVLLPLRPEALGVIQAGRRLDLQSPAASLSFLLAGADEATLGVLDCVMLALKSPSRPPQTAKPPSPDAKAVPRAEAMEMLIKLLNAAGAHGYRIGPPNKDTASRITFALADGTLGMFLAMRGAGTPDAEEYASYIIDLMSETCKGGNFMSGKQSIPSVDGSVVRKVVSTCRTPSETTVSETSIIRRANGFLMELTQVIPATSDQTTDTQNRAALVDAAIRVQEPR